MNHGKKPLIEAVLAWRNVWKNKRRTVLTLLTIMVGSAMVILFMSLQEGAYDVIIENAVSANSGHIQIHEKGFWEFRSIDYALIPDKRVINALKADPSIAGYTERVHAAGLVANEEASEIVFIQGVDPEMEKRVSSLHKAIRKGGRFLKPGDATQIVIGQTLAENLGVKVGDTLSIISQGFDGSIAGLRDLSIVGIFKCGNPEYDRYLILMPLGRAVETFAMGKYITSIAVRIHEGSLMPEVRERLKNAIHDDRLEIMGWDDLMPEIMQYVVFDRASAYIFYFVLYITVAFGVLNTIQMSVFERTREFGIMLAIGTRPGRILSMVVIESLFICIIGIILGALAGSALSYYFIVSPIDYTEYQKELEVWGFITLTKVPAKLAFSYIIETSLVVFITSMLFTIIPARRAARLKPVEAIRKL